MKRSRNDLDAVRRDLEENGAMKAYRTLLAVCDSDDAPAQAKAAAGVAVLRAAGLLDAKRRPADDAEPAEMTAEQLRQSLPLIEGELARLNVEIAERAVLIASLDADGEDDADIFA